MVSVTVKFSDLFGFFVVANSKPAVSCVPALPQAPATDQPVKIRLKMKNVPF